jgi:hypothetical protein
LDIVTASESSKTNKSRKKKEPDPLEVERQKELVRLMNRWFSKGKGRTQGQLHSKTGVATTTISDALKPDTITNTENTLAILKVITTQKEFIIFIAKFFPVLTTSMDFALKGIARTALTLQDFAEFAEKAMDAEGNIRHDAMNSVKDGMTLVTNNGFLYTEADRTLLIGGKVRGTLIMVSSLTFQKIADSSKETIVKVAGTEYILHKIDAESKIAVFVEDSTKNLVIVYSADILSRMSEKKESDLWDPSQESPDMQPKP